MAEPHRMNFCPVCGQSLTDGIKFGRQRRICSDCGFVHFHDPKVTVVVFITQDEQVLLIQRGVEPEIGKWALPAGYVDFGEDPREAAVREVKEETGLTVKLTRLIDVLGPEKDGTSQAIAILFEASVIGGQLAAGDDAQDACFFAPEQLPLDAIAFTSTHQLLNRWLNESI